MDQYALSDPRTRYPGPPFKPQRQEHPGLEAELDPAPDYGESTYRGAQRLLDRSALITGGDSGIGRATALAFAREGADVAIAYLPDEQKDAEETRRIITEADRRALLIPGDLRDEAHCRHAVQQVVDGFGKIDALVNCAAYQAGRGGIEDVTAEELDRTFRANLFAMVYLCREALRHMPPGATIVNTSSDEAYDPLPSLFDYAITKGAIANFTKVLAKDSLKHGVRTNAVAPGPVWTPILPVSMPPETVAKIGKSESPMGRPGQPVEIAPAYVFLTSGESSYVNGAILPVTGGKPLG